MKKHRIFIAINPSDNFKKQVGRVQNEFANLPMRWVKPENIHLTLTFIGYISDEETANLCKSVSEALANEKMFDIKFVLTKLGPNENSPRLIWLEGEENEPLARIKSKVENAVFDSGINYKAEYRKFRPHITIGRIKQKEWRENFRGTKIDKKINLEFTAENVEVMESILKKTGAEYAILETIHLK